MHEFNIRVGERAETFRIERDYAPGDTRQHWTLAGLEKLIRLQLWKRELDRGGNVKVKPPSVEAMMRLASSQGLASALRSSGTPDAAPTNRNLV